MTTLPDMLEPQEPARKVEFSFFDGSKRTLYVTDKRFPFPEGKLIVSRTNLEGIITHCNHAFVEISGYTKDELIGAPHSILRHPDMPRAAFAGLWETVESGKKWHGYVKNLRKDGGHYWVYATAIPNVRNGKIVSYTSVRRKISVKKIEEYNQIYAQMLIEEQ